RQHRPADGAVTGSRRGPERRLRALVAHSLHFSGSDPLPFLALPAYIPPSDREGDAMIRVRNMTFEDMTLGLRLKQKAGWNQTPADWARFLVLQPDGCFVADLDGAPAGTVTTCVFGGVGWVGMMLVDPGERRRGVGRELMLRALEFLESKGVRSVRLDATPMGEPLYRGLGFVPQFHLSRLEGELHAAGEA